MSFQLSPAHLDQWNEEGYLLLPKFLNEAEVRNLKQWTDELINWPEAPGKWMKYFEKSGTSPAGRQLCRIENFLQYHEGFSKLLQNNVTLEILSALMGEQAVLFKEKINLKLPGGQGFKQHQDAPAFTTFGQTYHITMMVTVDPATVENGCLDIVRGMHKRGIFPQEVDQTLRQDVIKEMKWEPVPMQPGDLLFFDSYLPHGSGPNQSTHPRRALYVTYNRKSEGERREDYFRHKRENFPPECERIPGVDYTKSSGVYNVGNPID